MKTRIIHLVYQCIIEQIPRLGLTGKGTIDISESSNWKKGLHRVYTPVSNVSKLADKAEKYKGCKYVEWYEFLTPKWVAPKRFTCTTLVWWCAKEVYDVKISPWYTAMVTPSAVLTEVYLFRVMMNIGILQMRIFIFSNQGH